MLSVRWFGLDLLWFVLFSAVCCLDYCVCVLCFRYDKLLGFVVFVCGLCVCSAALLIVLFILLTFMWFVILRWFDCLRWVVLVLMFDFRCFDCGFCCLLWFAYLCCGIVV